MAKNEKSIYFDKAPILSYGAFLNFIIGNRGGGKTYGFKCWGIDDAIKNGRQFAWVRRYGSEIKIMKKKFFDDIAPRYPAYKFSISGDNKTGTIKCDDKVIGYYFALTTSAIAKSSSYPLVDKIIFDEFLIFGNTHHYLEDEVNMFLELTESIFRDRETDPNAKVKPRGSYLCGNNITIANPYFLYFNIQKPRDNSIIFDKERGIAVQMYTNEKFIEMKKASKIGKLTAGTTYADYAIENKSYADNDKFIAKRTPNSEFYCCVDYKGRTIGFWLDYKNGYCYADYKFDPKTYRRYALSREDHSVNTFLIKSLKNTYINNIVWLFRNGCMFFPDVQLKALCFEIFSLFVR